MKIPLKEYTFKDFIEQLVKTELPPELHFKLACYITSISWEQVGASLSKTLEEYGIKIERLGDIRRLTGRYYDKELKKVLQATFYTYLDPESGLFFCFTDQKAEAIDGTLGSIADRADGIYYLFITPKAFERLTARIINEHPFARCTYFSAKHLHLFTRKGQVRPEIERTIVYYGEDALTTLDEVKRYYGAIPQIMDFRIPERGTYRIRNTGLFTLSSFEDAKPAREYMLKLADFVLKDILVSRKILESANFELIPVKTEKKTFEVPKITPWVITFGQPLTYQDADPLIQSMSDQGYVISNETMTQGSFALSGMVTDEKKRHIFSIDVNSHRMVVGPLERFRLMPSFDSTEPFWRTLMLMQSVRNSREDGIGT